MSMRDSLAVVKRLLEKHDHRGQAEIVGDLIELYDADRETFRRKIRGVDMWGGAGAVWEVGDLGDDKAAFQRAIIGVSDAMDVEGVGFERARSTAQIFREWNRRGI